MPNRPLEELLYKLSRKFVAKLDRISDETGAPREVVLDEGIELFRWRFRLLNRKYQGGMTPEQRMEHTQRQSMIIKESHANIPKEVRTRRATAGALGLKKKRAADKRVADAAKKTTDKSGSAN